MYIEELKNPKFPAPFQCYRPPYDKVYGGICMSPKNRVLLVRGRRTGKWSFPKGHKQRGEGYLACAVRETAEETGLDLSALTPVAYHKFSAGEYFFFEVEEEMEPAPRDNEEVSEARWMTVADIRALRHCERNVDVNFFLDQMRRGMRPVAAVLL